MADEPKVPPQPTEPGKPAANEPAAGDVLSQPADSKTVVFHPAVPPAAKGPTAENAAAPPPPAGKPAAPPAAAAVEGGGTPAKPPAPAKPAAAAPPKPPAPPKAPVKPDPWTSPFLEALQRKFPGAISEAVIFRNQPSMTVAKDSLIKVCEFLKSDEGGAYTYLADETAVDYPKREKRFEIIYEIYSFKVNDRLRLKLTAAEGEKVPSVVAVWPAANWLEREVFDMFGVAYEGHPDLRRILLPDGWVGYPLRKDYDILRQDQAWVKENLHIESGQ
jgi:NADH-quinone oxidoreductase subunit C